MNRAEVLARFDAELRRNPPDDPEFRTERDGTVVRIVGPTELVVLYSNFPGSEVASGVARQTEEFRRRGLPVEWKVYDHDGPPELPSILRATGYVATPKETLMVFDLAHPLPAPAIPRGLAIRRVRTREDLDDLARVNTAAFGRPSEYGPDRLADRLDAPDLGVYVAYLDGVPVSGGRVEKVPGRSFAGLWGGGTAPEFRGRGIYRALVSVRADFARERGARYLMVEALNSTSRPILERVGFEPLSEVVGWEWKPPERPAEVVGLARG